VTGSGKLALQYAAKVVTSFGCTNTGGVAMSPISNRKPLEAHEVVIHVPKGTKGHVKVEESEASELPNEITVQVSRKRQPGVAPVLGVIVK
jgi:hypothetical protein